MGVFFSRFTREELRSLDGARADEAARRLDEFRDPARYAEFLRTWTPVSDPFVHEARVHLFRRDQMMARVRELRGTPGPCTTSAPWLGGKTGSVGIVLQPLPCRRRTYALDPSRGGAAGQAITIRCFRTKAR